MHYSSPLSIKIFAATIAAAASCLYDGSSLPYSRRAMAKMPQQRQLHSLSPCLRHNGGCSRVSRRFFWQKIRNLAAALVLAAAPFGDKFANCATT
jgi:hypothetical protein